MKTPKELILLPKVGYPQLGPVKTFTFMGMSCFEDHAMWQLWRDSAPIFIQRGALIFDPATLPQRKYAELRQICNVNASVQIAGLSNYYPEGENSLFNVVFGYFRHNNKEYQETDFDRVLSFFYRWQNGT